MWKVFLFTPYLKEHLWMWLTFFHFHLFLINFSNPSFKWKVMPLRRKEGRSEDAPMHPPPSGRLRARPRAALISGREEIYPQPHVYTWHKHWYPKGTWAPRSLTLLLGQPHLALAPLLHLQSQMRCPHTTWPSTLNPLRQAQSWNFMELNTLTQPVESPCREDRPGSQSCHLVKESRKPNNCLCIFKGISGLPGVTQWEDKFKDAFFS